MAAVRVHLVGHDWGSVQGWHLVTGPRYRGVRSFTSISGPCLDHIAGWLGRRVKARQWADIAALWKAPLYTGVLQVPGLGPLLCRLGAVDLVVAAAITLFEQPERPEWPERRNRRPDGPHARVSAASVRMYAANLLPRLVRGDHGGTDVPVQVLTPTSDVFVPPVSQHDPHPEVTTARIERVPGGHWAPACNPIAIAERIADWIATWQPIERETTS